jgi:hypothetical protein
MKITQEELTRRLENKDNLVNILVDKNKKGNDKNNRNNAGRLPNEPNAPKSLRTITGLLGQAEGNSTLVAKNFKDFGISKEQVRYAAKKNEKLTEKKVQEIALARLFDAVGLLDLGSLSSEKPKDIASIAANLSRVHRNLAPASNSHDSGSQVNITIYSPELRKYEDYEVIEVQSA